MKRIRYALTAGAIAVSLAGCSAKTTTATTEAVTSTAVVTEAITEIETAVEPVVDETEVALERGEVLGGWTKAESPELTDEVRSYFADAFPDDGNIFYEPVALLGTQVVSGTNYKILYRQISISSSGASDVYGIGTIYVDLQNNVAVLNVEDTNVPTHLSDGGWTTYMAAALTDDEKNAFQDALNGLVGVSYDPITIVAESDTGYLVLCDATIVYPGAETGSHEIEDISDFPTE